MKDDGISPYTEGSAANGLGFEALEPDFLTPEGAGWRQRRSNETRLVILNAAIHCFAEYGSAQTTLITIAEAAQLSRSAMMHHFPTKQALVAAVTEFAFYQRLIAFREGISALSDHERIVEQRGVDVSVALYDRVEYRAYLELASAARTDPELAAVFLPKAKVFETLWREEADRLFPEWRGLRTQLAYDFTEALLEGLTLNRERIGPERAAAVIAALKAELRSLAAPLNDDEIEAA